MLRGNGLLVWLRRLTTITWNHKTCIWRTFRKALVQCKLMIGKELWFVWLLAEACANGAYAPCCVANRGLVRDSSMLRIDSLWPSGKPLL